MKESSLFAFLIALIIWMIPNTTFSQKNAPYLSDQIVLQFKTDAPIELSNKYLTPHFGHAELDDINRTFNIRQIKPIGSANQTRTYQFIYKNEPDLSMLMEALMATQLFNYVEPNYIGYGGGKKGLTSATPNDPLFSRQYNLVNDGTFRLSSPIVDADIDMDLAWNVEQGDSNIIVAILDSGVNFAHPELRGRFWINPHEQKDSTDNDGNDLIDDFNGWDFVNDDNDPADDHGHGTNVTGIVFANPNNNSGYAGVDWHSRLMVCKILNENNFGLYTAWASAIYYAVDQGAKVINMSVGGEGNSFTLKNAIDYAYDNQVTVVACMMNENTDQPYYPAGYANTIAVGSTNPNDERSVPFFWDSGSGSNYGDHIDVVAPGNYIYGLHYQSVTNYNSYWGGTSQATPLVTGLAALLVAQDPSRTPDDIRSIIQNTAEDQVGSTEEDVPGFDPYYGYGRINAHQALLNLSVSNRLFKKGSFTVDVFPNPAINRININAQLSNADIQLYNHLGQLVLHQRDLNLRDTPQIKLPEASKGIYWLKVLDPDKQLFISRKIMIQ